MEPIAQRLYEYFFKYKGYKNDTVVANLLGYSHPEKISRLFREGKSAKPSADILQDITNKFGNELNISWVLTGKGEMINIESFELAEHEIPYPKKRGFTTVTIKEKDLQTVKESLRILQTVFGSSYSEGKFPEAPKEDLLGNGKDQDKNGGNKDK